METTYTKSRCNESLSSLQGMLKRERTAYDPRFSSCTTDSDYAVLRRSLIDVYDEVFDMIHLHNRDTVAVAISYLDRFMMTERRHFINVQLAAMTCFYLAVKLYEPTVITPHMICELFQRTLDFEEDDVDAEEDDASIATVASAESVESMEMTVLSALKWNLNPPTSMMFVRQLLSCLPDSRLDEWKLSAVDLANSHLEIAIKSEEARRYRASSLAVAALFVATEKLPVTFRAPIYKFLLQAVHMTAAQDQREIIQLQSLLRCLVSAAAEDQEREEPEPVCTKRAASSEDTLYDERPSKRVRSDSPTSFTSSPRSILFPIGYGNGLTA